MVQQSQLFAAIKKGVTNRLLQEFAKFAENDAGKIREVWDEFRRGAEGRSL